MQSKTAQLEKMTGHTYWQWILTILANMTTFSYGLDVGWMSPMAKVLQSDQSPVGEPISDTMLSWVASNICLGAIFTVPVYSYIADRFGSRISVLAIVVPQAISWITRLCFSSGVALIISRLISGFAAGGCFNATVMFIKEVSQDNIRGLLGSTLILFQNTGVFIMYVMGAYLGYFPTLWAVAGIPIVTGILLWMAPDTPAFMVKQGRIEDAIATIAFLRGLDKDHKIVLNEINVMKNEDEYFKSQPNISLLTIVKNPIWRRAMFVSTVMIAIQASNGAFTITTYASTVLASTGVKLNVSAEALSLIVPAVLILGSSFATLCIERIGRRTLYVTMLSLSACSFLCIAVSMVVRDYGMSVPGWLPILAMMVTIFAFAGGISATPFIVMAEMFNFQIRAKVLGLIVTFAWFITFIPILGFIPLSNALGFHTSFFIFAAINITGAVFSTFFQPETRGKSVEQIEKEIAVRIGLVKKDKNFT